MWNWIELNNYIYKKECLYNIFSEIFYNTQLCFLLVLTLYTFMSSKKYQNEDIIAWVILSRIARECLYVACFSLCSIAISYKAVISFNSVHYCNALFGGQFHFFPQKRPFPPLKWMWGNISGENKAHIHLAYIFLL